MRNKQLYNYLVNTLGVSKQMVMDYVSQRLEDLISKHIESKLSSNHAQNMILDKITQIMQHGIPKSQSEWWTRIDFDTYLKKVVHDVVQEKLAKEYDAEIKLVHKETQVVKRI